MQAELVAPHAMLREVLRSSLLDAIDALAETCDRPESGDAKIVALRRAVDGVSSLSGLFARSEQG